MEKEIRCTHCGQRERQNKQGKTKAESQKYLCRDCKRVYTLKPKRREYSEEIKKQAIKLYLEGNSGLAVSRILGISKNMCFILGKEVCKENKA